MIVDLRAAGVAEEARTHLDPTWLRTWRVLHVWPVRVDMDLVTCDAVCPLVGLIATCTGDSPSDVAEALGGLWAHGWLDDRDATGSAVAS